MNYNEKNKKIINKITRYITYNYYLDSYRYYTINDLINEMNLKNNSISIKKYLKVWLKYMLNNKFIELYKYKIFNNVNIKDDTKFKITYAGFKYLSEQKRIENSYFTNAGSFIISILALFISTSNALINNKSINNFMFFMVFIIMIYIMNKIPE